MVVVFPAPPALSGQLDLFHTTDPLLYNSPILVFFGQAASVVSSSSRIQVHIFTPAGLESYNRLSISPNSPYYAAVNALPREEQGDEICRGIAYALSKYFTELPAKVKEIWTAQASNAKRPASPFGLFSPTHVAVLASKLTRIENAKEIIGTVQRALGEQRTSWLDVDVVLPADSIQSITSDDMDDASDEDICRRKYGRYAPIIAALGEPSFLPTSKMRRAASKPTMVGRATSFKPGQQEVIRKEMCELVDTEANYVQKLMELHNDIKPRFETCEDGQMKTMTDKLFPESLTQILDKNAAFLSDIQSVLDATEEEAMLVIEADQQSKHTAEVVEGDAIGILDFSKTVLKHLPEFEKTYSDYMAANAAFPNLLRAAMGSKSANVKATLQEIGEQRLTALLIEPVQRLPRYTLYIDTISKQLPIGHPALAALLKARDIVTNICLSDGVQLKNDEIEERLQNHILDFDLSGMHDARLVSMLDVSEWRAPYEITDKHGQNGILILFTNRILFVEKLAPNALTARALQAAAEHMVNPATFQHKPNPIKALKVAFECDLRDCTLVESLDGKAITLFVKSLETSAVVNAAPVYRLESSYSGKASKFAEEFVKARLESRFPESDREEANWEVRSSVGKTNEANLFAAVYDNQKTGKFAGHIRVEVDLKSQAALSRVDAGVDILVRIAPGGTTFCSVAIDSAHGSLSREKVSLADLTATLCRRMVPILQARFSLKESPYAARLVARNRDILESLDLTFTLDEPDGAVQRSPSKNNRVNSPVKTLSSFLSNKTNTANGAAFKRPESTFTAVPNLPPPANSTFENGSRENSRPSSKDDSLVGSKPIEPTKERVNPFKKLEDILSTYLLAIQARKGNVVGRVLKARANADQAQVNELYNSILEDPNMMVLAAQASVDVLFAAFERFLHNAWTAKLGPVMDKSTLEKVQLEAESRFPVDFDTFFLGFYQDLIPQNQRALRGIVKLLADLLDGAGNDGDRGILTAAFTELLVPGEDSHPYIPLMDRLVDDIDVLFGDGSSPSAMNSVTNLSLGHGRSKSVTTGSLNSNTSSLRRKFGFGGSISKESSRSEYESKVGSVWRSLSKNKYGSEPGTPRGTVQRTKSTDTDIRPSINRPASSDRPATLGSFTFERPASQDSSYLLGSPLSTIGENAGTPGTAYSKKKRRSSLSDLSLLQSPQSSPLRTPGSRGLAAVHGVLNRTPNTPSRIGSPTRTPQRSRLPSSFRSENSLAVTSASNIGLPRPRASSKQPDEVTITTHSPTRLTSTTARPITGSKPTIPPPRIGLSEKSSANAIKIKPLPSPEKSTSITPTTIPTPTRKLRLQSPQRIRERLQSEQRELHETSSSLQDELSKIGDEIGTLGSTQPNARTGTVRMSRPVPGSGPTAIELAKKLNELSQTMTSTLTTMQEKSKKLSDDTLTALNVAENRTKRLDELYRESNAENEALYKRFNDELGKVVKAVRGGDGVDEMKRRIKGMEEEMEGLRRERARLRREVVGLRGRLGE